jgi:hypothetical protein
VRRVSPPDARLLALTPFLVALPEHLSCLDLAPLGIAVPERFDPLRSASAPFLERLVRLDRLAFGPEGMPMPRWLFYEGADLPGAIVGLGRPVEALDARTRDRFGVAPTGSGLAPLAMYIALPTVEPGVFFGHNLASVGRQLPTPLRGLGRFVKALGVAAYRCTRLRGATQWDSPALHIHVGLGPLRLLTAWTPAHSEAWTLTYEVEVREGGLRRLAGDPRGEAPSMAVTEWMDPADHAAQRRLQAALEAGEPAWVVGRPEARGVPIHRPAAR